MKVRFPVPLLAAAVLVTLALGIVRVTTVSGAPAPSRPQVAVPASDVADLTDIRRTVSEETSRSLRRVALRVARQRRLHRLRSRTATQQPRVAHVTSPNVPGCTDSNIRESVTWQEAWIIDHESGWSTTAQNPSGAFGLGQLMPQTRYAMSSRTGIPADTTDACGQVGLMRAYIAAAYGSDDAAVAHWQSHGWY